MEQVISLQSLSAQPTLRGLLGLNGGQAVQGDAFAMIFQQLMGQDGDFTAAFAQMMQDNQEEADELCAQMAAEMLYTMPNPQLQMMLSQVQPQLMAQGVEETQDVLDSKTVETGFPAAPQLSALENQGEDTAPTAENLTSDQFYTVLQNAWKEEPQQQPMMGVSFQDSSLRAAKELLAQKQKDTVQAQPVDVESLQADVNTGRFLPLSAMAQKQTASLPDVNEVAAQLKSGILDNVAQGKNEFVVRLKPEGIGEIVVKLSDNKEKISLSIFTTSTQTAKMITNEVAALQNALRPLHAEVEQIVVAQPSESASNYAAQTAMSNQEHQFQGQQFYGQGESRQGGSSRPQEGGEFGSAVEQVLAEDDGLDTYI